MTDNKRSWISSIIGLIAVLLIIWLSPTPIYQAQGIILPAEKTRPPIMPSKVVQLFNHPYSGQIMGYINIERHYPAPDRQANKEIASLAEKLSAQVGANAYFVTFFRIGRVTRSKYIYVFQATAYYVQNGVSFLNDY